MKEKVSNKSGLKKGSLSSEVPLTWKSLDLHKAIQMTKLWAPVYDILPPTTAYLVTP